MLRRDPSVVVFSGGGTGGHFYPALALARALAGLRPDIRPFFVGSRRGVEARVLPDCGLDYALVDVEGLDRRHLWNNALVMQSLLGSVLEVFDTFRRLRPELVVVTGGYACAPSGLVAACMGIPLALQEQNSLPGVTTRLLSRHAAQIHLAWPEARQAIPRRARDRVVVSGNPVRPPEGIGRGEARTRFGLAAKGHVALVVGGSQGSAVLNRRISEAVLGAPERPEDFQLLWASGPAHFSRMSRELARAGSPDWVRLVPYIDDMPGALAAGGPGGEPGGGDGHLGVPRSRAAGDPASAAQRGRGSPDPERQGARRSGRGAASPRGRSGRARPLGRHHGPRG